MHIDSCRECWYMFGSIRGSQPFDIHLCLKKKRPIDISESFYNDWHLVAKIHEKIAQENGAEKRTSLLAEMRKTLVVNQVLFCSKQRKLSKRNLGWVISIKNELSFASQFCFNVMPFFLCCCCVLDSFAFIMALPLLWFIYHGRSHEDWITFSFLLDVYL